MRLFIAYTCEIDSFTGTERIGEIIGTFSSIEKAKAACTTADDFILLEHLNNPVPRGQQADAYWHPFSGRKFEKGEWVVDPDTKPRGEVIVRHESVGQ